MPEIDLKHYEDYCSRLRNYAAANGIAVLYKDFSVEGQWDPRTNTVTIDNDQSQSSEIASFLHELGHSTDDLISKPSQYDSKIFKAYNSIYANKGTKKQKALVLEVEQRAWKNGRDIAARLKIRLGKWYDQAEAHCLKTYRAS